MMDALSGAIESPFSKKTLYAIYFFPEKGLFNTYKIYQSWRKVVDMCKISQYFSVE